MLLARWRSLQRSHGMLRDVDEARGQLRHVSELSAGWHQGGLGACEFCGVRSGPRVLIAGAPEVWRLCDDCAEALAAGDSELSDRVWNVRNR